MNILLCGDTHMDTKNITTVLQHALENDCSCVFILGDFGYWPNLPEWDAFIKRISYESKERNIPIYFLLGNHEDWASLKHLYKERNKFHEIFENVFYSPTGNTFVWNGVKFMTVGGAYSIDRANRIEQVSWFPEEELGYADYEYCSEQGKVDILLTHDCPEFISVGDILPIPEALPNRKIVEHIFKECLPSKLFHGHYHRRVSQIVSNDVHTCEVNGLNCNFARLQNQTYVLEI